ncbi:uncharacterized protein LOC5521529 [Nematostella vectensis]|uniref:uncharacterized protein LOC5521529 n=1 Tax=Nematostella vectensis TaxID=45351 RepID=UPI0013906D8B|nr:uncharacterized protein LOC5521529 [Nematostella vectensis]
MPGVLTFLLLISQIAVVAACPGFCHCDSSYMANKTVCRRQDLWLAPPGVSPHTTHLDLLGNLLITVTRGYLRNLRQLLELNLGMNQIDYIASGTFTDMAKLELLDLSGNQLTFISEGMFTGLRNLTTLYLSENRITRIESGSLLGMHRLTHLFLFMNEILDLPASLFWGTPNLKILSINRNNITKLHQHLFRNSLHLEYLFMQFNELITIPDDTFGNTSHLRYIFMDDNNLTTIKPNTFKGARALEILSLTNNVALKTVEDDTFNVANLPNLRLMYILNTQLVRIRMSQFKDHQKVGVVISPTVAKYPIMAANDSRLQGGLGRNGFTCDGDQCTPCHFGEFQTRENDTYYCKKCPPGGFYQNAVGHFGKIAGLTGCRPCARGTYVKVSTAPGKVRFTCKVCPAGTRTDQWSNYRGCFCIDNFYRKHRFGECEACPKGGIRGVLCNETQLVREGYWWQFRNYNESWGYQYFLDTLMEPYDNYDLRYLGFDGEFPKAYPCPRAASCLGLLNSVRKPCEDGYGGPLCEVCEKGFHKSMSRCVKCPTLPWLIVQLSMIGFIFLVIILILLRDERKEKYKNRTLTDVVLARLKIVVGFYQVTSGTLDAFSYIEWPDALLQMTNYAKFLQLNLVQIAPLHCFTDSLKLSAYDGLVLTVGLNLGVVVLCLLYYNIKKQVVLCSSDRTEEQKIDDIHYSKSNCYRSAFLILFITFPETSSRILGMLPPACMELCQDRARNNCTDYLKADYTINCFDDRYNKYVKFAYAGSVYPIIFPLATIFILYTFYYRKYIRPGARMIYDKKPLAVVDGLKFVYENYSSRCWYWEIVEMIRKLVLTSGLSLIGSEGRTYVGMAAMASGFYAVAHAQARPIPDNFEHLLQLASLVATFFNLSVGMLLRIPKVMTNYTIENDKDSVGVTVILIFANIMVTGLVVARYVISLGQSFLAVVRNPHCSWECCLSVVLSVQEAGSDLTDMKDVGAQDFKGTLQQGETFEITGVQGTIGDMGLLDMGVENQGMEKEDELMGPREDPVGEEAPKLHKVTTELGKSPLRRLIQRRLRRQKESCEFPIELEAAETVIELHDGPVSQDMGHRSFNQGMMNEGFALGGYDRGGEGYKGIVNEAADVDDLEVINVELQQVTSTPEMFKQCGGVPQSLYNIKENSGVTAKPKEEQGRRNISEDRDADDQAGSQSLYPDVKQNAGEKVQPGYQNERNISKDRDTEDQSDTLAVSSDNIVPNTEPCAQADNFTQKEADGIPNLKKENMSVCRAVMMEMLGEQSTNDDQVNGGLMRAAEGGQGGDVEYGEEEGMSAHRGVKGDPVRDALMNEASGEERVTIKKGNPVSDVQTVQDHASHVADVEICLTSGMSERQKEKKAGGLEGGQRNEERAKEAIDGGQVIDHAGDAHLNK